MWLVSSYSLTRLVRSNLIPINSSPSANISVKKLIQARATVTRCVMCVFSVSISSSDRDRSRPRCANTLIKFCVENRISPQRTTLAHYRTHVPPTQMHLKMAPRVHFQRLKSLPPVSAMLDRQSMAGWKGPMLVPQVRQRRRQSQRHYRLH